MSVEGGIPTNTERLVRIDERTERMEKDIFEIKRKIDNKIDKDLCRDYRKQMCRKVEEAKKVARSKMSREECSDKHEALEKRVAEQKDDWKFWVMAVGIIISLLIDVIFGIRAVVG